MKNLEKKLTRGSVVYIESLDYDKRERTVFIRFFPNIESDQVDRTLKFFDVTDLQEDRFEDYDDTVVESIIGLDVVSQGVNSQFIICTEVREIRFLANSKTELSFI